MVWEYRPIPDGIRLPPCPNCANRGRVSQFARFAYYCGDCLTAFCAIWHEEPKAVRSTPVLDKTSATMRAR